jgi:hypothetical protein
MEVLDHLARYWTQHRCICCDRVSGSDAHCIIRCAFKLFIPSLSPSEHSCFPVMGTLWMLQSSQPGLSIYSALPQAYGISYYTVSLSTDVVVTILIATRLMQHRRMLMQSLPANYARHYLSIVTVLIESAALYSCFAIGFLISYAVNNPINQIFISLVQAAQVSFIISYMRFFCDCSQTAACRHFSKYQCT